MIERNLLLKFKTETEILIYDLGWNFAKKSLRKFNFISLLL